MTGPDPAPHEDQVRRLLADARHDAPVPEDVADRLDAVLADLAREERPRAVTDLAAARRRRARIRTVLVAAAAVVLVGFGISRVDLSGSSSDSSSAGSAADSSAAQENSAAAPSAPPDADLPQGALAAPVRLTSGRLEQQVRRLVDTTQAFASGTAGDTQSRAEDSSAACGDPSGPGTPIVATYDGAPAVLVLRPRAGGVQVADVYLCGERTPVRSVTVPVG